MNNENVGEKQDGSHHLRSLLTQLRQLENVLRVSRIGGPGPRSVTAMYAAIAAWGLVFLAMYYGVRIGIWKPIGPPLILSFVPGALVMWLVERYSSVPQSYGEKIEALLAAYVPVSIDAYRAARKISRADMVYSDALSNWLLCERAAVSDSLRECAARSTAINLIDRLRGK